MDRERINMFKEQIYARLAGERAKVQVFMDGRTIGRTYDLFCALDECLLELYEQNKRLLSNQQSIIDTNQTLLNKLYKIQEVIDGKNNG